MRAILLPLWEREMHCSAFLTQVGFIMFNVILLIEPLNCLSLSVELYFHKFRKKKHVTSKMHIFELH